MVNTSNPDKTAGLVLTLAKTYSRSDTDINLFNKAIDWRSVFRLAKSHGILPYLHKSVSALGKGIVPQSAITFLNGIYLNTAASNLLQVKELNRIQEILSSHGYRSIGFKGPILAQDAYKNIGLRQSVDLDILIPSDTYAGVKSILLSNGFELFTNYQNLSRLGQWFKRHIARQVPFRRTEMAINLDVHMDIMPPGYSYSCQFGDLYTRSKEMTIQSHRVRSCSIEDHLLILTFHGAKNRWESLKYGCDVAQLISSNPDLDWGAVRSQVRTMRATRILHLGLLVASRLFGAELPDEIEAGVRSDSKAQRAYERVAFDLTSNRLTPLTYGERFRFNLSVQDTFEQQIRYCLYALARRMSLDSI